MLEGEKNNLQAHTRKKNFIVNQDVEKKFHDQTKSLSMPKQAKLVSCKATLVILIARQF